MTITRAQLEAELVSRRQTMMKTVGMDITFSGANPDLNSPISYGVRQCGGTVANFSSVATSDLVTVDEADLDKLIDLAEYRLLMNMKGRWGKVDIRSGPFAQSLSQFGDQLDKDMESLKANLETTYGFGGGSLEVGVIDMSFMETDPDA